MKERKKENGGSKEDMNKPTDISTISVNRHEKMGAFKSKSLWQPTATEGCGENMSIHIYLFIFFTIQSHPSRSSRRYTCIGEVRCGAVWCWSEEYIKRCKIIENDH